MTINTESPIVARAKAEALTRRGKLPEYESHEYPGSTIAAYSGLLGNARYDYVSSQFLDGLINYTIDHRGFMMHSYGSKDSAPYRRALEQNDEEVLRQYYQSAADRLTRKFHFKPEEDDWLIFSKSKSSYWFFWYNRDCSDCSVARYDREINGEPYDFDTFVFEQLVEVFHNSGEYLRMHAPKELLVVVEAAHPLKGWINSN